MSEPDPLFAVSIVAQRKPPAKEPFVEDMPGRDPAITKLKHRLEIVAQPNEFLAKSKAVEDFERTLEVEDYEILSVLVEPVGELPD